MVTPNMVNALLAYGTRNGATADTAEEIAKVLRDEGITVTVVNLKDEKEGDITGYNLVVVDSGIQMGKWPGEAEGFLGRHHTGLTLRSWRSSSPP
jgi:menaquinone-dependent protoporphyrinogen oxidase